MVPETEIADKLKTLHFVKEKVSKIKRNKIFVDILNTAFGILNTIYI